ncbi:MAG: hypothetical protein K2N21_06020 [Rikenellaceae bacterium]|nr:hypothetical protein [Rikenellaceae bacterium]
MRQTLLTILVLLACASSLRGQDMHLMTAVGVTPQNMYVNPAVVPERSYLSLPLLGAVGINVGTSLGYGSFIRNGEIDGAKLARKVRGKAFRLEMGLDLLNVGVRTRHGGLVSISDRVRVSSGSTYPAGLFDYLFNNPLDYSGRFDLTLRSNVMAWNETALGYHRKVGRNFSVGGRVKFIAGLAQLSTNDTRFTIDKDVAGSLIRGKVDITGGNIDLSSENDLVSVVLNPGMAFDIGAQWRSDDNRWRVGLGLTDMGFIKWSGRSSSRIYSSGNGSYRFEGFGDLDSYIESSSDNAIDSIYNDLLKSIDLDTVAGYAHTKAMPMTMNLSGEYDLRGDSRHVLSMNFLGTFGGSQTAYYALTAGYRYTSANGRFSAIAALSNKRVDPLSVGVGLMANLRRFQFYAMSDFSISCIGGGLGGLRSLSYRAGMNFFWGKEPEPKAESHKGRDTGQSSYYMDYVHDYQIYDGDNVDPMKIDFPGSAARSDKKSRAGKKSRQDRNVIIFDRSFPDRAIDVEDDVPEL